MVIGNWASDAYVGLHDLETALNVKPPEVLGTRRSYQTDRCLGLKLALDYPVSADDVVGLFGPKLTEFGRKNIGAIIEYLDVRLHYIQAVYGRNLLLEWSEDARKNPDGMDLFSGHQSYVHVDHPEGVSFSLSPTAETFCADLVRDAENTYREDLGLPKVGEGWIAETQLFYAIKQAFPDEVVIQHGRPTWLGRQHLDVYFPDRRVALEYQGEQHDRPVEFFGGEEAFERTQKRDRQKRNACRRKGVEIIYVREGYDIDCVVNAVQQVARV